VFPVKFVNNHILC